MQVTLSLRARLLVVMTAALLPLLGVHLWGAMRDTQASMELARSQLRFSASLLAANQERIVDTVEQLLGAIAQMPEMRALDRARCQAYFESLRDRYPVYSNIGLIDTEGQVLCHALGSRGTPSARDRDYFNQALAHRRFVIGEPIVGRIVNQPALPFAMPVLEQGAVVGVVFASLDLPRASRELGAAELPAGARVTVADRHGHILMQFPAYGELLRAAVHEELLQAARTMQPFSGEGPDRAGEMRLYALAPTKRVGDQGFVVRVGLPAEAAKRATWERGREEFLVLATVMALAMLAVWWIGGRMIVKPAKQILGAARRIEQGRLDARVPVLLAGRRDEFARLGAAFNLMADSLQMRQADLEAELGRSRGAYAVLDQVLNSMQEGLIAVTREGKFLLHNAAAGRILPLSDAPVLPELWPGHFGIHYPGDRTPYRADDLPLVRAALGEGEGQALLFVRNALVPEGRLVQCTWHRMQGDVPGGLVVFSDVTQLQRLEAEQAAHLARLQEAQRKLTDSQRVGRVGNWELDLRTGRLWWSDEVYALYGIAPESFGHDLQAFELLVHADDRALFKPARDQALRDGKVMNLEYRIVRPDGSVAWMHEIAEARRDASGEPVWFGGVVQDVTERKAIALENARLLDEVRELNAGLESRIAERTAQLRAANQELEAFSYSVSHDLRAPLGAIGGFARALEAKLEPGGDERTLHYFGRIQAGVRKMEELIEALLQLSRFTRAPLEWADVDLGALARETAENLQLQDPQRKVELHVQDGLVARGDERLLRAAIENLVGNAWKFTAAVAQPRIDVGRSADGAFYVRDNGVGFDMAYADKLFTAFHRLHKESEFPGTGIGLATVRRIVTLHQGRVWAQSQPGAGTTFYFTL
ncbi:ATP-binding protein [Ramlibacter sp. PS4R-6]|uniref:ATP-binding protein n=1 Tax=Ramlibacter sp. PS4R-6 TaxID=3133438 RepID=UPI00309C2C18